MARPRLFRRPDVPVSGSRVDPEIVAGAVAAGKSPDDYTKDDLAAAIRFLSRRNEDQEFVITTFQRTEAHRRSEERRRRGD